MTKILLLSDTHSYIDDRILEYAQQADEIWHAGDFGTMDIAEKLMRIAPLKGVFGNIDGQDVRMEFPETITFMCEEVRVSMLHIGGYPKKYTAKAKELIAKEKPQILITGHSHILKVMYDEQYEHLHLNPGAAGKTGWHKVRTMMRFEIEGKKIQNLEVIELGSR